MSNKVISLIFGMNLLFDERVCYAVCIAIIVIEIAAFTPQDYLIKDIRATPSSLDNIVSITSSLKPV
jgi:hypothetical protein